MLTTFWWNKNYGKNHPFSVGLETFQLCVALWKEHARLFVIINFKTVQFFGTVYKFYLSVNKEIYWKKMRSANFRDCFVKEYFRNIIISTGIIQVVFLIMIIIIIIWINPWCMTQGIWCIPWLQCTKSQHWRKWWGEQTRFWLHCSTFWVSWDLVLALLQLICQWLLEQLLSFPWSSRQCRYEASWSKLAYWLQIITIHQWVWCTMFLASPAK